MRRVAYMIVIGRRWLALGLLCCAFFIDTMGSASVFTASPAIERALGLGQTGLQWSFTAATLPAGALLLVGGRLADLFGRRRMFAIGLALFSAASLGCGLAPSVGVLITARAAQGIAGAFLLPAALGLVIGTFAEESERNRALAAWSAIGGTGATAGLLLGGLVTAGIGWQWVFLVNVPVGALMLALCPVLLIERGARLASRRIDLPGTVTVSVGLGLLIYAVSGIPNLGWTNWRTLGVGVGAVFVLGLFVRIEMTGAEPIVPPRLVRSRQVVAGNSTLLVAGMCVDGLLFTVTLYTQHDRGYTALQFGAVAAVMTASSVGAAWIAQRAVSRFGARPVSTAGLVLLALTSLDFALTTAVRGSLAPLIAGMLLFGLGMGAAFVAGSVASLQDVGEPDAGIAAAVQNISFTLGSTLGVAALSTVSAAAGNRAAFATGSLIAVAGLLVIAVTALRPRRVPQAPAAQPAPARAER